MESDKAIRTTILNLGLSGQKADLMRKSFESSAMAVAEMGGTLKDIQAVQEGFANETGRARVMTAQMVQDIVEIGRGTGLGVEEATKLGAQFELMGVNANLTKQYVQKIVDTSENMGLSSTKILKAVNDNFKRLNTYSFQGGVQGMMKMSQYAAKMNIDMNEALNAADVAKSLEGAIDLAAQLQIMGGEFAKADPFQLLFLSRNDPEKYTEKINEMTKGVVTLKKNSEGVFEKFISPADRQRLAAVATSLHMNPAEMIQQAERMWDIQKMRQNMLSSSLTKKDQEIISGAAIFNSKTGMFQVQVGETAKNISEITESEAKLYLTQQKTLEDRAKDSLTFQESLEAFVAMAKTTILPMLRGFNSVLQFITPPIKWLITAIKDVLGNGFAKILGGITAAAMLLTTGALAISKAVYTATGSHLLEGTRGIGKSSMGGMYDKLSNNPGAMNAYNVGQTNQIAAKGTANLKTGLGVGAAGLGIGAGIGIAAVGIGQLAKSIKDVDIEKLKVMNTTLIIVGATMIGMGIAATFATAPVWAFGLAAAGIGIGIGAAAAGIGYMANGFANLVSQSKNVGPAMIEVGAGIAAMNVAMGATGIFGFIGGIFGFIGGALLSKTLSTISSFAEPLGKVGEAFKEINIAMSGSKEDYQAIESAVKAISSMNTSKGSAFAELAQLLKTPLKVEFADKKVNFTSDITMLIDGQKFMQKVLSVAVATNAYVDLLKGKGGK
jgi:hypothetical protein